MSLICHNDSLKLHRFCDEGRLILRLEILDSAHIVVIWRGPRLPPPNGKVVVMQGES